MIKNQSKGNYLFRVATYLAGITLLFSCAQIYIPLEPVPITLQTVGVMLTAFLYQKRDGIIIYVSYLFLGIIGFPMFAGYKSGIHILFGPRGGYLIGFLIAIYAMNEIKNFIGMNNFLKIFINTLAGTALIYIFGVSWLSLFIGVKKAIMLGFIPFIIPGIIKAIILSVLLKYARRK